MLRFLFCCFFMPYLTFAQNSTSAASTTANSTANAKSEVAVKSNDKKILAKVNGATIYLKDYQELLQNTLMTPSPKKISTESVLDFMINRQLVIQQAYKDKLNENPVVKSRMDDVIYGAGIATHLDLQIAAIKVTDEEVSEYYKKNKEYRTSQILARLPVLPTKEEFNEVYQAMQTIYQDLKKDPTKFEEFAKKYAGIAASENGGDIGFVPPTGLMPEYFEAINGKSIGYITPPVRTQYGYHIIKVTGIKDEKDIDRNLYKKIIFDIKRDNIIDQYYRELKQKANVTIYKENFPSL